MNPEQKKLLQELGASPFGTALKAFLNTELGKIKDVSNAKSWDDTLARQHAAHIIEQLFSFLGNKTEGGLGKNKYD